MGQRNCKVSPMIGEVCASTLPKPSINTADQHPHPRHETPVDAGEGNIRERREMERGGGGEEEEDEMVEEELRMVMERGGGESGGEEEERKESGRVQERRKSKKWWKRLHSFFKAVRKQTPESSSGQREDERQKRAGRSSDGPFHLFYDVGEILGAGSFGKVFKGTRICDGKQVAIKFVQKRADERLLHTPDSPNPLFAEVALNVLLQKAPRSQHVLQMYEWFDEPKQRILILEHPQPCETLLEFVWRKGGRLDETLACGLMRQAVLGIRHCLDRGVHHNDLKMDNILVNTETLQLKLIDFGCGVLLKHAYEDNQGRLKPDTDALTVLSLGIMLYKMVNGLDTVIGDFDNLKCDVNMSKECSDWMSQCLKHDQTKRAILEQLIGHEWFQQVDG